MDELDKVTDSDRSALHEAMEQGTCSVSKAGIVATLNARTSILAAANPRDGKYDLARSLKENVEPIPVPLLTRFDLVHIVMDKKDPEIDDMVASHILSDMQERKVGPIDIETFRKYLTYAKKIEPKLTNEARDILKEFFLKMRKVNSEWITVTSRQLEGLVRLATAHARILLKDTVDVEDAERAIYLVMKSLDSIGTDIDTGVTKYMGKLSEKELFLSMLDEGPIDEHDLVEKLLQTGRFTEQKAKDYIRKASKEGLILEQRQGVYTKWWNVVNVIEMELLV